MKIHLFKGVSLLATDNDIDMFKKILSEPGHDALNVSISSIIETDQKGRITFFMPNSSIKWSLVFFVQNLMIRQRLFEMDQFIDSRAGADNDHS